MLQTVLEKYKLLLIFLIILLVSAGAFFYQSSPPVEKEFIEESFPVAVPEMEEVAVESLPKDIFVDVKGAVKKPGIYKALHGERVNDLIIRAGGFIEEANEEGVNLAQKVLDEMVIYVPVEGEEATVPSAGASTEQGGSEVLNINHAAEQDFDGLPGIGPAKAKAIIQYRAENGPFKTIEDLKNVTGIGEATFERLKENITVN
ncbi:helix-hairpin-helix domain-containing protein [Bacillus sp. SCS-153A]|uniref:helix-hairpin-helix domain-containing protein n=1 Tax=Rossellomorea sedimentorum TaxID=3115294 RepID=UPI003905B0B5